MFTWTATPTRPLVPIGKQISIGRAEAQLVAKRLMEASAKYLQRHLERERASTGRLGRAITDPRAYAVTKDRILLFDRDFMFAQVPYWLAIDRGSSASVGRYLHGVWHLGGEFHAWGQATGELLYRSGSNSRVAPVRQRPEQANAGAQRLLGPGGGRTFGRIGKAIGAHNYIEAAREAFTRQQQQALVRHAVKHYMRNR